MRFLTIGVLSGLMLFLAACSGTKVTSSWKEPDVKLNQDQKIMVVALVNDKQDRLRPMIESEMVAALKERGYNAIAASRKFNPKELKGLSEQKALNRLRGENIDQVLTVVLLDKDKEKSYVPGNRGMWGPYPYYYGYFGRYYGMMYDRIYQPGYYTTNTKYYMESNLYSLDNRQLLYTVKTETFDPSSAARMAVVYSQQVVKDMTRQQLISKR